MAKDAIGGQTNWGTAKEFKYDNPFAGQIALTKAQRNAMRSLIPPEVRRELIYKWVEEGRVSGVNLAQEPKRNSITERQMERILIDIAQTGTDTAAFLEYYGVQTLEEMSKKQANQAIGLLGLKRERSEKVKAAG